MCMCVRAHIIWEGTRMKATHYGTGERVLIPRLLGDSAKGHNTATGLGAERPDHAARLCQQVIPTQSSLFRTEPSQDQCVRLRQQRHGKVFGKHLYKRKWTLLPIYSNAKDSDSCLSQRASQVPSIPITGCFRQRKKGCEQSPREAVLFNFSIISKTKKSKMVPLPFCLSK